MMSVKIMVVLILSLTPLPGICADLEVRITQLSSAEGQILVGVYDNGNNFLNKGSEFTGATIEIIKATPSVTFRDIPDGIYAVAVIHDQDRDGKLGKNFLGIPNEGYGFSNNAEGNFGPPSFAEAAIAIETADQQIFITINY